MTSEAAGDRPGVVAELGTHAELVERDGQYADIYRRQADAYRR